MISNYFKYLQKRFINFFKVYRLLINGTVMHKSNTIQILGEIVAGEDIEIDNGVTFKGKVILSDGVYIGQNCLLEDCSIGANTKIKSNSMLKDCNIGSNALIGPYARIRPKTSIDNKTQIGTFVEVKNSNIGSNCKINHLTFIGDSQIMNNVIIGAGSVTCNYDGRKNQQTHIEDDAFIGSGVFLVAPLTVGRGATIGSGSVITEDVPPKKLTLARSRQITIKDWKGPTTRS